MEFASIFEQFLPYPMSLSPRDKQNFYYELGQFLHAGLSFPRALESLLGESPGGATRRLLERLLNASQQGASIGEAFAKARPDVGDMEVALISASSASGRIEHAITYLASYFQGQVEVRQNIIKQSTWPVLELHLGVLIAAFPELVAGGGMQAYLTQTGGFLLMVYAVGFVVIFLASACGKLAGKAAAADRLLRAVPLFGKLRLNLAASRFCGVYEMQLQAAINTMDALTAAARASQSALIIDDVEAALPKIRAGAQAGEALAQSVGLPKVLLRSMRLGEESGRLDEDLKRWTEFYRQAGVRNLEALGKSLPFLLFLAIAGYLGYRIVHMYSQTLETYQKALEPQ